MNHNADDTPAARRQAARRERRPRWWTELARERYHRRVMNQISHTIACDDPTCRAVTGAACVYEDDMPKQQVHPNRQRMDHPARVAASLQLAFAELRHLLDTGDLSQDTDEMRDRRKALGNALGWPTEKVAALFDAINLPQTDA